MRREGAEFWCAFCVAALFSRTLTQTHKTFSQIQTHSNSNLFKFKLKLKYTGKHQYMFIESICNDAAVLEANYRHKMRFSPDYAGVETEAVRLCGLRFGLDCFLDWTAWIGLLSGPRAGLAFFKHGHRSARALPALAAAFFAAAFFFLGRGTPDSTASRNTIHHHIQSDPIQYNIQSTTRRSPTSWSASASTSRSTSR